MEPIVKSLLANTITAGEAAILFPDRSTVEMRNRHDRIKAIDTALAIEGEEKMNQESRTATLAERRTLIEEILQRQKQRRLDVLISSIDGKLSMWIDVTTIHLTQVAERERTFKFLCQEMDVTDAILVKTGSARRLLDRRTSSPGVLQRTRQKFRHYQTPLDMAKKEATRGARADSPTFYPCVMGHRGELGRFVFDLIEVLTRAVKAATAAMGELSWETPKEAAANFRQKMKNRLVATMAKGWGEQLLDAGDAASMRRRTRARAER